MVGVCERNTNNSNHCASGGTKHLPPDIISEILSWLPIEDILRYRSVCKTWYGLTKHPHFTNLQLSRTFHQAPRVIFIPKSPDSVFLLDTKQNKVREIPLRKMHRQDLRIMGSCNGFLCMTSERMPNPVIVCNPITREQIFLPESVPDFPFFDHRVGLGYDLSTKKYKVVRMYMDNSQFSRFQIITIGEHAWKQLDAPYRVLFWGIVGPIYCEGALYWIIDKVFHSVGNEYILVLDLSDEEFRTITIPSNIRMPRYNPDLHDGNLQLLNLAGIITLIEDESRLMHAWRVISNRGRNSMVHHCTCDLYVCWNVFSRPVLVSMLGEDSFLLEVSKFGLLWERDLVQYFPQRRQYYNLKIDRLPTWFRSICFSPNLVSSQSLLFGAV